MRKAISLILVVLTLCICSITQAFAIPDGTTMDDIINSQQEVIKDGDEKSTENKTEGAYEKNKDFINGLNEAGDLATADVEGAKEVTEGIKYIAAVLVQIISYATIALLAVRVVLDLAYIGLPFTRCILGRGFIGNAQAGAGGFPNSMTGSVGGYGASRSMSGMGMESNMASMNNQTRGSQIQLVSNAALNAVASEGSVGTTGQAINPFKLYAKDMVVVLVIVPVLTTLAVTGVLTNLGFMLGSLLMDLISNLGNMI